LSLRNHQLESRRSLGFKDRTGQCSLAVVFRPASTQVQFFDLQVLEETLHCIPDHVLDAPPRRLEAYQQNIAGLTDVELPASPWASAAVHTQPAAPVQHQYDDRAAEEVVAAVEALQLGRTREVAVMA